MKTIKLTIVILFGLLNLAVSAQSSYPTSSETHIFWQPDVKLTIDDYQGQPDSQINEMMDEYGFAAAASVGIWSVLDIPKRRKDRFRKFGKAYFAPAFEKTTSYVINSDPIQIEMQNLYFDICEVWARWARKELKTIQDSTNSTGILSIFYKTVNEDMHEHRIAMYRAYFKEVFVDKVDGAFEAWRQELDERLEETKSWATTPEECYRLMTGEPLENGYIEAPSLIGPMRSGRN